MHLPPLVVQRGRKSAGVRRRASINGSLRSRAAMFTADATALLSFIGDKRWGHVVVIGGDG
jgi:hypothetical protein